MKIGLWFTGGKVEKIREPAFLCSSVCIFIGIKMDCTRCTFVRSLYAIFVHAATQMD